MRQKTIVYIDAANIILSMKSYNLNVNIEKLITYIKDKFRPNSIIYFTAKFSREKSLYNTILSAGVEMVFKEIYNEKNKTKANCDVEISHRITRDLDFLLVDKVVLFSGDGDFVHVLDYARNLKKEVKVVAATPLSCSIVIKRRGYLKVSYLVDDKDLLINNSEIIYINEKPPTST